MCESCLTHQGYSVDISVRPHPKRGYLITISCEGEILGAKRAYSWREAGYYVNQGVILFDPKTRKLNRPLD
jgi:hypothetical protein